MSRVFPRLRNNFLETFEGKSEWGRSSFLTQLDRLDYTLAMARQLRIQYEGAIYRLMSHGDRREETFRDDLDRKNFLQTFGATWRNGLKQ